MLIKLTEEEQAKAQNILSRELKMRQWVFRNDEEKYTEKCAEIEFLFDVVNRAKPEVEQESLF